MAQVAQGVVGVGKAIAKGGVDQVDLLDLAKMVRQPRLGADKIAAGPKVDPAAHVSRFSHTVV